MPDDIGELVYRNVGILAHLLDLTDAIQSIDDISYQQRTLRAEMRSTHGAIVNITLSQQPSPDILLDLTIRDHMTSWRQLNDALYQGRSPQTILQGLNVYQDDLARFTRGIRVGAPLHPSKPLWLKTLNLAAALTQVQQGPLDTSANH